ncbi:MAG: TA system VapC family ribonuclease toxin [Solirubrobacteraceae bacterium]
MILVDANLLIYAVHVRFDAHEPSKAWLDERLNGPERVGLPWAALLAFVRLSASSRVMTRPMTPSAALAVARAWLSLRTTWTPAPTERHAEIVERLLQGETKADVVPDAHLAALAIEHGLTLHSCDRDFARFEGLRWVDPLRS